MKQAEPFSNLEQLLDRLSEAAGQRDPLPLSVVVEAAGHKSFAPLLLVAGLMALSPLSAIPGMPTTMALLVMWHGEE